MNIPLEPVVPAMILLTTQIYWATLMLIGATALVKLSSKSKLIKRYWASAGLSLKALLSIATGFILFLPAEILGYATHAPALAILIYYLVLLALAILVMCQYRQLLIKHIKTYWRVIRRLRLFSIITPILVIIGLQVYLTLMIGSHISGDGLFHTARIRDLFANGLTFDEPLMGRELSIGHSIDIFYILVMPLTSMGIDAGNVWSSSLLVYQVASWLVCYCLIKELFSPTKQSKKSQYLPLAMLAFSVIVSSSYMMAYPNSQAKIWLFMVILGVIRLLRNNDKLTIMVGALLLTFTHPLSSLSAILLLGLVGVASVIFLRKTLDKGKILTWLSSVVILSIYPFVTKFAFILQHKETVGSQMEAVNSLDLSQIGGLTFVVPKVNQILGYGISNGKILALFAVISLIGIITLFVLNRKNKINLVLLSALVLFVPLLFWNPLATPILQQILPTWGIQRVMSIDLLSIVALPAGIVGIVMAWNYVTRKARRLSMDPAAIMVLVSILVVLIFQPMLYFNRSEVFSAEGKDHLLLEYPVNINIPESIDRAAWMFEGVNQGTVLTGDQYQNYFIPAWTHLKALDYTQLDGDPSFLTTKSYLCWDYLVHNFDSQELELSGVDYVYTTKGSTLYEIVMDNEKYFQAIRDDGMYFLFQLDLGDGKITMSEDARCDL